VGVAGEISFQFLEGFKVGLEAEDMRIRKQIAVASSSLSSVGSDIENNARRAELRDLVVVRIPTLVAECFLCRSFQGALGGG